MKKILYSLILLSASAALFAQPRPDERPPKPEDRPDRPRAERPHKDRFEAARERWEAMEEISVTGEINYVFEKRDGERPEIQRATIEKDGILYKIHFPIHLLDEEGIAPGSEVTVSGKSAPSMWMNDDSVSVFAKEIQSGGTSKRRNLRADTIRKKRLIPNAVRNTRNIIAEDKPKRPQGRFFTAPYTV